MIHGMSGTPIVESFGAAMYDRADFFINSSSPVSPFADRIPRRHREHAAIVAAIERGDPEAARTAASSHILNTRPDPADERPTPVERFPIGVSAAARSAGSCCRQTR